MSEKEGQWSSARTAQLAMLVAVGAALILSGPSEARQRLQEALDEVKSWPHDMEAIRSGLMRHCDGGLLDLPSEPKLGWFFEHRKSGEALSASWVYTTCVRINEGSDNHLNDLSRALGVADDELTSTDCSEIKARIPPETKLPNDWTLLSLAGEGVLEAPWNAVKTTYETWDKQLEKLCAASSNLAGQERRYAGARSKRGAYAGSGELQSARNNVKSEATELGVQARAFKAALAALRQASAELRNLPNQLSGSHVVLRSSNIGIHLATRVPVATEQCVTTNSNQVAPDCSIASSLHTERVCFGSNADAFSLKSTDETKRIEGGPWNFARLTQAGVWADIRELDVASAESRLYDDMTKAELETEVFGLKLERVDALRWLWLAILGAETYALCSILFTKPTAEEREDWWYRKRCQSLVGAAALVGIVVSVASFPGPYSLQQVIGKHEALTYWAVLTVALLIAIALLAFAVKVRRKDDDVVPARGATKVDPDNTRTVIDHGTP